MENNQEYQEFDVNQEACNVLQENGSPCNKTSTLQILHSFNNVYQQKLDRIDSATPADSTVKLKYLISCDWISSLISQNKNLIETLDTLEREACQQLLLLENKLKRKESDLTTNLKTDLDNVLEIIRRAREYKIWNADGLIFNEIKVEDIFGVSNFKKDNDESQKVLSVNVEMTHNNKWYTLLLEKDQEVKKLNKDLHYLQTQLQNKDVQFNDLKQLKHMSSNKYLHENNDYEISECSDVDRNYSILMNELQLLNKDIKQKLNTTEENNKLLTYKLLEIEAELKNNEKTSLDTRVLVLEVAEKHDAIMKYRNELTDLEKQLKLKDTHIHFKDEIIKELRRQCRKLTSPHSVTFTMTPKPSRSESSIITLIGNTTEYNIGQCTPDGSSISQAMSRQREAEVHSIIENDLQQLMEQNTIKDNEITNLNAKIQHLEAQLESADSNINILKSDYDVTLINLFLLKLETVQVNQYVSASLQSAVNDFISGVFSEAISVIQTDLQNSLKKCIASESKYKLSVERGIEKVLINMRNNLSQLKCENIELKESLANYDEEFKIRSAFEHNTQTKSISRQTIVSDEFVLANKCSDRSFAKQKDEHVQDKVIAQNHVLGSAFVKVAADFVRILGKPLSDESLSAVKNGNSNPFTNLMYDLQKEIESKDSVLKNKEEIIMELQQNLSGYEKELHEYRKRYATAAKELESNCETIGNLQHAVDTHIDTITQLQKSNDNLLKEFSDIQQSISTQNKVSTNIVEENRKLEIELKHQMVTISNLRMALEDSKRSGKTSSPVKSSRSNNTHSSSIWSWWRNTHNV